MTIRYYICTRSLRNGALSFVATYSDAEQAQRIASMAQYGVESRGPFDHKYVVITSR